MLIYFYKRKRKKILFAVKSVRIFPNVTNVNNMSDDEYLFVMYLLALICILWTKS